MKHPDCLFCKFAAGEIPCHRVWEDDKHLAFLTIFPNTEAFTVIITKDHNPSDALENDDAVLAELVLAAKKVAVKIKKAYVGDVGRVGLMLEGFGVDHLHAKLFPMHGTGNLTEWKQIESHKPDEYFDKYPGYMSSHDAAKQDDEKLAKIAESIRNGK